MRLPSFQARLSRNLSHSLQEIGCRKGLVKEICAGRDIATGNVTRGHNHPQLWPPSLRDLSEFKSVHAPTHTNVREQNVNLFVTLQNRECLSRVLSLKDLETRFR